MALREKWDNYRLRYPNAWSQERQRIDEFVADLDTLLGTPAPPAPPPAGDRDATCAWDCALPYPHNGPCSAAPPAVQVGEPMPGVRVGDVVLTERGRLFRVDLIQRRPAHCSPESWQGAEFQYHGDEDTGGAVLSVAVLAVYRDPLWRRREGA